MPAMTLRLPDADAELLDAIARAEGRSVASLLREAVTTLIAQRRADPTFRTRVREAVERNRQLLEQLAE